MKRSNKRFGKKTSFRNKSKSGKNQPPREVNQQEQQDIMNKIEEIDQNMEDIDDEEDMEENDQNEENNQNDENNNEDDNDYEEISENDPINGINQLEWKPINVPAGNNKSSLNDLFVKIEEYTPQEGEDIVIGKNLLERLKKKSVKNKIEKKSKKDKDDGDDEEDLQDMKDDVEGAEGGDDNGDDEVDVEDVEGLEEEGKPDDKPERKLKLRGTDMDKQFYPNAPKVWIETQEEKERIEKDMIEWNEFDLDIRILKALHDKKFYVPTEIQKKALVASLRDRKDIIGAAETGSGKTLAFGIPMLQIWWKERQEKLKQYHLEHPPAQTGEQVQAGEEIKEVKTETEQQESNKKNKNNNKKQQKNNKKNNKQSNRGSGPEYERFVIQGEKKRDMRVVGLILTPTRELAVQIAKHLEDIAVYLPVRISTIIGGISEEKQIRILNNRPEIIVATPGRFWDLFSKSHEHLETYPYTRFLIFDEADRMISAGHFRKLYSLLGRLPEWKNPVSKKKLQKLEEEKQERENKKKEILKKKDPLANKQIYKLDAEEVDEDQKWLVKLGFSLYEDEGSTGKIQLEDKRITYLYSATLTLSMKERSMSTKHVMKSTKGNKKAFIKNVMQGDNKESQEKLEDTLIKKIDFHNKIELIDVTSGNKGVASSVSEAKIECAEEMKDNYLFYFLKRYCGMGHKTIVFVNTISTIRKLISLLKLLEIQVYALHGAMHQKQRLKSLEKFTKELNVGNVLIATDVASRGIDIPKIDHVVHYQIPASAEIYIHRSGRTGRAGEEGVSLSLVSPTDMSTFKHLTYSLNNKQWVKFPIETGYIERIANMMVKAKQLDQLMHQKKKTKNQNNLENKLKKSDPNNPIFDDDDDDEEDEELFYKRMVSDNDYKRRVSQLQNELSHFLSQPLIPKGVSMTYITKGKTFEDEINPNTENKDILQDNRDKYKLNKLDYALKVIDKEIKKKEERSALHIIKTKQGDLQANPPPPKVRKVKPPPSKRDLEKEQEKEEKRQKRKRGRKERKEKKNSKKTKTKK